MRMKLVVSLLCAALALAACGGGDSGDSQASSGPRSWTETDLERLTGLRKNPDFSYALPRRPDCVAELLLRSTAEVQTYKDSGDVIVTNPDRSAGVKLVGQSAACRRLFTQAFRRVR
jgi:hypothetical protein